MSAKGTSPAVLVDAAAPRLEFFESVEDSGITFRFSKRALNHIRENVLQDYAVGNLLENGGVLFGRKEGRFVYVFEALPLECEHQFGPEFRLSASDEVRLEKLLQTGVRDWRGGILKPVGWYCSHSTKEAWVQERDLHFHAQHFGQPFQLVLIGTRRSRSGVEVVAFLGDSDGRVDASRPGPRLQLAPSTVNSEGRKLLQPGWILTAVALILLAVVLWKIGLAAGFGTAARIAPLQAQAVNSGLLITWDAGRNLDHKLQSAKLRVKDGENNMLVPLTEELLRKGMLLYLRHSSPVFVTLQVERESLPTEQQTVIYMDPAAAPNSPTKAGGGKPRKSRSRKLETSQAAGLPSLSSQK